MERELVQVCEMDLQKVRMSDSSKDFHWGLSKGH